MGWLDLARFTGYRYVPVDGNTEEMPSVSVWGSFKHSVFRRLYGEKSPEEAELVSILDKRLLGFAMLGYFLKVLDMTNLANAYISGMEEELNVQGIDYNWMYTFFWIGYLLMQVPSNALLTRVRPSLYLPCLELLWFILTLSMGFVRSVHAIFAIRFLLGLAEAGFYPGMIYLIGSWYTKEELGKRSSLFITAGSLGGLISGVMQAALLKGMNGVLGLSSWRWLFIIDASITLLLSTVGFLLLPDYPNNTKWLTQEQRELAVARLAKQGRSSTRKSLNLAVFRTIFSSWQVYAFVAAWMLGHAASEGPHQLGIVAKKVGFDAVTANLLTSPLTLIDMVCIIGNGYLSDRYQTRKWCIVIPSTIGVIGYTLLGMWVQPFGFLYFAFLITVIGTKCTNSIVMTWVTEVLGESMEHRALIVGIMNTCTGIQHTVIPLLLWPVTDAPYFTTGFRFSVLLLMGFIATAFLIDALHKRDLRRTTKRKLSFNVPDGGDTFLNGHAMAMEARVDDAGMAEMLGPVALEVKNHDAAEVYLINRHSHSSQDMHYDMSKGDIERN
ncbi:hypothetical protein BZG36_02208 [Bifiguratus adelaidae]|uniref:Major facilitator superfamily (MFS) profile domain-containing protein n=1 Tax=Bifiguratus adelaidae TaxID=1938954 RepID=A0A261Y3Y7_9FUNG|nr:hypothetical protein BZG36_02208 [Bifiguratus adelaidae]